MRRYLDSIGPCLVLPPMLFFALACPDMNQRINQRLPLLPAYYFSRQMAAEMEYVEKLQPAIPAPYSRIISEYRGLRASRELNALQGPTVSSGETSFPERAVARSILWWRNLPPDFLSVNPFDELSARLAAIQEKESRSVKVRQEMLDKHVIDCLKGIPPDQLVEPGVADTFPPGTIEKGLVFSGERIPLGREDVRKRIEYQIKYLLNDLRDTTVLWLARKDRYGNVVRPILAGEALPPELSLLPALESGYNGSVVSRSMAKGWWQFVRDTAVNCPVKDKSRNWTLRVDDGKDERRDLAISTRSAARYLKWTRSQLSYEKREAGWLMVAAAYNAGLTEIRHRASAYGTNAYWDVKLPQETENYVPRWIALYLIDSNRDYYRIEVPDTAPLEFDTLRNVRLMKDLPLSVLATTTGCSVRFIREINGALENGVTSFRAARTRADRGHTIHVPRGTRDHVLNLLKTGAYLRDGT